jgi:hypothetical protein
MWGGSVRDAVLFQVVKTRFAVGIRVCEYDGFDVRGGLERCYVSKHLGDE